jgi:LacI family transcriptional regulator
MATRLKDIAADLGVSVVTVSKVLRNHSDISEETRDRVMKRIRELNYQPNLAARALVTGRSSTIGLIVPDLVHPFFAEVAKGITRQLREHGYVLMISSSEENGAIERQEIAHMLARRVDALLLASVQSDAATFRMLEQHKTPVILLDRRVPGLTANFVGVDDEDTGCLATDHLIAQGCQRIAHIRGPEVSTAIGRVAGYQQSLAAHGIPPNPKYIITGRTADDSADRSGYEAMQHLLALTPRPDGVFCFNDPVAMGAMQAVLDAGLRVPEDVAVVGCGNIYHAPFLRVPLTSIDQNSADIGENAARLALSLVGLKKPVPPRSILLESRLVARASTLRKKD